MILLLILVEKLLKGLFLAVKQEKQYMLNMDYKVSEMFSRYSKKTDLTRLRLTELDASTLNGRFSVTHLLNIHKYIFQDIYPFAGKIRVEEIWKGDTFFCRSDYILENLRRLLNELKNEGYLKSYNKDKMYTKLAYYMSELNIIHPFREGNGRAIREFIRQLAQKNGYFINWYRVEPDILLNAIIAAVDHDMTLLDNCFEEMLRDEY